MKGEERIGNERRDTPTTSISHERRGSALAAERAGRDEGRVEEKKSGERG